MKILNSIKYWLASFLFVFGVSWLFFEPLGLFCPEVQNLKWCGYLGVIVASIIFTLIFFFPRKNVGITLGDSGTEIKISQSDILQQNGSIIFSVADTFDTELGDIISPESIFGQFLTTIYNSNRSDLDNDIQTALKDFSSQIDDSKSYGKKERYPIGTIACLSRNNNKYFLVALNKMLSEKKRVSTNIDDLWNGLYKCWKCVRDCGNHSDIHIPVIGTKFGRTGLSHNLVIQLIVTSFIMAMKEESLSPSLTIHIHKSDVKMIDFPSLHNWLKNLGKQA